LFPGNYAPPDKKTNPSSGWSSFFAWGRPAGLALAAMWYLGKTEVTPSLVDKIRHKSVPNEFEALRAATSAMPA